MILVDVYAPSIDQTYEFKLDEDVPVSVITDEISSVICQKERCELQGDKALLRLFSSKSRRALTPVFSLYENGVKSGDCLIIV